VDLIGAASLVIYVLGSFTFGAMTLHQIVPRLRGSSANCGATFAYDLAITIVSFLWFVGNLLESLLGWTPEGNRLPIQLGLVFFQLLFPPLVMQVIYNNARIEGAPLRPGRWKIWYLGSYLASLSIYSWLIVVLFLGSQEARRSIGPVVGIGTGVLFGITAIYCFLVLSLAARDRKKLPTEERSSRRAMLILFGIMLVFVVLMFLEEGGIQGLGRFMRLFGTSMPLMFIFTSLYHKNRLDFVDLVVKRCLTLLLTFGLLVAWFVYVLPLLARFESNGVGPWVRAIAMLPLAVTLPFIYTRMNSALDHLWFGRRFTTVDAVKEFLSGLQGATGEHELVEHAEQGLQRIFRAPVRIDLSLREAPSVDFQCVVDIPIGSGDSRAGAMLLGRRESHIPYLSEDRALLESLAEVFSYMLQNIRLQLKKQEQEKRSNELSHQASLSELKALRAQINPHFLFNALNAIAGLIHKDPFRADSTVEQLAEVFRYTLRGSEKEWARLEDELDFVGSYLDVEQARFGERLGVSIEIDDDVKHVRVPTMVVQTLVENAVKHGVASVRGAGRIDVAARREGDLLVIEVADNGTGPSAGGVGVRSKGEGFGLKSIRERFMGYYGDRAELTLERDPLRKLTVARISLPLSPDQGWETNSGRSDSGTTGAA